ncbi:MAG: hypothetical protein ACRC9L_02310 [Brevinema sp.]
MVKAFILFIMMFAPIYAMDTDEQITLKAPVPEELASSPLIVRINNEERIFPQTMEEIFLKRELITRNVADGANRVPSYLPGILSNDVYILPLEIRSQGRRFTVANFFFRIPKSGTPYLFRWEELNFINRSILRYDLFPDVLRAVGYIDNLVAPPSRTNITNQEETAISDTQSSINE